MGRRPYSAEETPAMTLMDTGPLIALVERTDPYHLRAAAALASLPPGGMITTCPCFSEITPNHVLSTRC